MAKPQRFSTVLDTEEVYDFGFEKMVEKLQHALPLQSAQPSKSQALEESFFEQEDEALYMVDTQALHEEFMRSQSDLFGYIDAKEFEQEQSLEAKITLYCQLALMYESDYEFSSQTKEIEQYHYLLITPKETDASA
jgi:hypothetical protein